MSALLVAVVLVVEVLVVVDNPVAEVVVELLAGAVVVAVEVVELLEGAVVVVGFAHAELHVVQHAVACSSVVVRLHLTSGAQGHDPGCVQGLVVERCLGCPYLLTIEVVRVWAEFCSFFTCFEYGYNYECSNRILDFSLRT